MTEILNLKIKKLKITNLFGKEKFECDDCGCYYWVEDRDDFDCPNCEENDLHVVNSIKITIPM